MGVQLDGVGSADYSGTSVAGGFDFNKDGYGDVIIGAPGYVGVTFIPVTHTPVYLVLFDAATVLESCEDLCVVLLRAVAQCLTQQSATECMQLYVSLQY
jgi:FG-GAP repeat